MQMLCLENWDLTEKDHTSSLCGAIEALESSTLRLPLVGGAKVCTNMLSDQYLGCILAFHIGVDICLFFSTGRYSQFGRCYLFSSWCNARDGIFSLQLTNKGYICNNFENILKLNDWLYRSRNLSHSDQRLNCTCSYYSQLKGSGPYYYSLWWCLVTKMQDEKLRYCCIV